MTSAIYQHNPQLPLIANHIGPAKATDELLSWGLECYQWGWDSALAQNFNHPIQVRIGLDKALLAMAAATVKDQTTLLRNLADELLNSGQLFDDEPVADALFDWRDTQPPIREA